MVDVFINKAISKHNSWLSHVIREKNEQPSQEPKLDSLSAAELAAWGSEHATELEYRVELARRIAETFGDADTLLVFDDLDLTLVESDRASSIGLRGCDRSLLPSLWFSTGFQCGGKVIVYAPPNPVEMKTYMELKMILEEKLQRLVPIQILYETEEGEILDILEMFNQNSTNYTEICEQFAQRPASEFCSEFYLNFIKQHFNVIAKDSKRIFVFPYWMSSIQKQVLKPYEDKLVFPDLPSMDKAEHHFLLRSHGFQDIPHLLAISPDGTISDDYESYVKAVRCLLPTHTEKTPLNIETFARAIIRAVDRIRHDYHLAAFIKLDAKGAGGWCNISPELHTLVYDSMGIESERIAYLAKYITENILDEQLPSMAVVEELIEPQKRPGNVDADYAIGGFVLNGIFFPTSANLLGTENSRYVEIVGL